MFGVLQYLVAIILVLIIVGIVIREFYRRRYVKFGEPEIMIFDKDLPPNRCQKVNDYVSDKKNRYEWLKIHMPATMKHVTEREIPGYVDPMNEYPDANEHDLSRFSRLHRQFTSAATTASHIELDGFNTSGREWI